MKTINRVLTRIIDAVGVSCSIVLLLMILNVFIDVLMRYLFNNVSIGMQEMEWHLFAAMFMFGIGYTLKEDGHVRVDVVYDQLSARKQAIVNIVGGLVFTVPFSALMGYYGFDYAKEAFLMGEGSGDPGGLPNRWIVRSFISLSSLFLIMCSVQVFIKSVITLRETPASQEAQ